MYKIYKKVCFYKSYKIVLNNIILVHNIHIIYVYKYLYNCRKEIEHIKISSYIRDTLTSLAIIQTRFQLFISILSYVLLGNYITVQKVINA